MIKLPYRIGIIAPAKGPTDGQLDWMRDRLKELVRLCHAQGIPDDCVEVRVCRIYGDVSPWVAKFIRPQHVVIETHFVPNWRPNGQEQIVMGFRDWADEVWCLNAFGQTNTGRCPSAQVYRHGSAMPGLQSTYKLIPSWAEGQTANNPKKGKAK